MSRPNGRIVYFLLGAVLVCLILLGISGNYSSSNNSTASSSEEAGGLLVQKFVMPSDPQQRRSAVVQKFLETSEKIWKLSVQKRHEEVERTGVVKNVKKWGDAKFLLYWDYFHPSFSCPYPMERIGRMGDGGKWVCGFSRFEETKSSSSSCIVYSFGVAGETSFEAEIVNRTDCRIWAFDPTVEDLGDPFMDTHPRVYFKKYWLADKTTDDNAKGKFRTLGDIMKENGHDWIDILKVDIEGSEFPVFRQVMKQFKVLPFGQLQIELHLDKISSFTSFYGWWEELEGKGLRPIRLEPNNHFYATAKKPTLMEVAFLNVGTTHRVIQ